MSDIIPAGDAAKNREQLAELVIDVFLLEPEGAMVIGSVQDVIDLLADKGIAL